MKVFVGWAVLACFICTVLVGGSVFGKSGVVYEEYDLWGSDLYDFDPWPSTNIDDMVSTEPYFPNEHHWDLVYRLSDGIASYKIRIGGWWECGVLIKDEEGIRDLATSYSFTIVSAAYDASGDDSMDKFMWGLAGIVRNESDFDRCALGTKPRKVAYKRGLLKRNKRSISHTEDEVLAVVESKVTQRIFRKTGFDLGTGQLLSRFYPDRKDFKVMMSLEGSTEEAARNLKKRSKYHRTKRPWLHWRGTKRCNWYAEKVERYAARLGANTEDI